MFRDEIMKLDKETGAHKRRIRHLIERYALDTENTTEDKAALLEWFSLVVLERTDEENAQYFASTHPDLLVDNFIADTIRRIKLRDGDSSSPFDC